jgi:kynurenine formamidase
MSAIDPGRMVDLTEPWSPDLWPYPGHPSPSQTVFQSLSQDRINTWVVTTTMHVGTHVDGPLHCATGGEDIASLGFDRLVRPGYVVDLRDLAEPWYVVTSGDIEAKLPGPLEAGDALILRYGWQRFAKGHPEEDAETYFNRHPGPGPELVEWLIGTEVAWVGTDAPSFEHPANINLRRDRPDLLGDLEAAVGSLDQFDESTWMVAHRRLFERGQLHVDQVGGDLDRVGSERVTLAIFPWRYVGGEASICRLVAFI